MADWWKKNTEKSVRSQARKDCLLTESLEKIDPYTLLRHEKTIDLCSIQTEKSQNYPIEFFVKF